MSEISFKLKLVLLGEGAVGKTSLVYQFVNKKFKGDYTLTVGVDFLSKNIEYEPEKHAMLSLWDIGGQKRFESIRSTFYRGASGVLLVFDLTRPPTFENITTWHNEVKEVSGNVDLPFILIGNKVDLIEDTGRVIDEEATKAYAAENGSIYIETSAKSGENVEEAFLKLTQRIIEAQTKRASM